MKIKQLCYTAILALSACFAQAETKSFESSNINSFQGFPYPALDLNGLDQIKIRVNQVKEDPSHPIANFDLQRVEFNFPNANNLIATNFQRVVNSPDTYRTIITSPWVFKKLLVEVVSYDFFDKNRFNYRIMVVENNSNINNIDLAQGTDLIAGDAELVNVTKNKVVDVVRTKFLNKPLTLRLYDQTSLEGAKIQAVWMGHGTKVLTLSATIYPEQKPVALLLETVFEEQRVKVKLDDAYHGPETPDESLRLLLEQAFGPLPYPETPLPQ